MLATSMREEAATPILALEFRVTLMLKIGFAASWQPNPHLLTASPTVSCDNQVPFPSYGKIGLQANGKVQAPIGGRTMQRQPERWLTKRWQTDTRYYVVEVTQDLFGNWLVKRSWGGLRSHRGSSLTLPADNYDHALALLAAVEKRRKGRRYTPTP